MFQVLQREDFRAWVAKLRDLRARIAIGRRLERMQAGNFGDVKPVGAGVYEARIDVGPGYRVYFVRRDGQVIIVLAGGDKSTQDKDIRRAQELAKEY